MNNTQYVPNPTGWIDPLGLQVVPKNGVPNNGEKVYRTVYPEDKNYIDKSNQLPSPSNIKSETMVSKNLDYVTNGVYEGELYEFILKPNAINQLEKIGVRDQSRMMRNLYPDMPIVTQGWAERGNAFFKSEKGAFNIGLGKSMEEGHALPLFNSLILKVKYLGKNPAKGRDN